MLVVGCLLSGALIGFIGGILGIGGGLVAIPLLGLVLGMDQQAAQGTALIMVVPAVLLTIRKYNQHDCIDRKAAAISAAASILFTWAGARLALGLEPVLLRRIYGVFVLGLAVFYLCQVWRHRQKVRKRVNAASAPEARPSSSPSVVNPWWYVPLGCVAGLTGGFFGVGGSLIAVPMLTAWMRHTQTQAQALGLTMVIPGCIVALVTYARHGQADWQLGIPLAIGSLLLVPYGVRLAYTIPEPRLKLTFACMLLVIMVLLMFSS